MTNNIDESKSLNEVREWKKQLYNDTMKMNDNELIEYFGKAPERLAKSMNAKIVYTNDNKIHIVRDNEDDLNYNVVNSK